MTLFDSIHLFHLFTHSLELILVWSLSAEGATATIADIVLENADIALSGLQSLIMLIYTTVYAFKLVSMAFNLVFMVTEVLSEILNLCHE